MPGPWVTSSPPLRARPNPHDQTTSCPSSSTQTRRRASSGIGGPRRTITTSMTTSPTMHSSRWAWAAARSPSTCAGRTWGPAAPLPPSQNRTSRRGRTYQTIGPSRAARSLPRPPLSLLGAARGALASTNPTETTATSRAHPRGPLGISVRHRRRRWVGGSSSSSSSIRDPSTRAMAPTRAQALRLGGRRRRNRCRAIRGTCRPRRCNAPSMGHAMT